MPAVRVVVADDHPVVRSGISDTLKHAEDIVVVGEAASGKEALRLVETERPDVLLLDVEMPDVSGVEVAQQLKEAEDPVRILALSSYDDREYVRGLLEGGARGYLTKEKAPRLITEAVRAIADGEVRWFVRPAAASPEAVDDEKASALTEREREVLTCLARGHSNQGVAEQLYISENTVRKHTSSLYAKLRVGSAREAIAWAWQSGFMASAE